MIQEIRAIVHFLPADGWRPNLGSCNRKKLEFPLLGSWVSCEVCIIQLHELVSGPLPNILDPAISLCSKQLKRLNLNSLQLFSTHAQVLSFTKPFACVNHHYRHYSALFHSYMPYLTKHNINVYVCSLNPSSWIFCKAHANRCTHPSSDNLNNIASNQYVVLFVCCMKALAMV